MNLARARVLFFLDLIIVSAIIFFTVKFFSPVHEILLKQVILILSFLLFIYTFDGYEFSEQYRENILYNTLLIIAFSLMLATLVNYVLFFKIFGRKIYLLVSFFIFVFLIVRFSIVHKVFAKIKKNIYFIGDIIEDSDISWTNIQKVASIDKIANLSFYDIVVVTKNNQLNNKELNDLISFKLKGYKIFNTIDFFEYLLRKIPVKLINDSTYFFTLNSFKHYDHFFKKGFSLVKRLIDIVGALLILFFASFFMMLTAIAIKLESEGDVIFKQKRTGLNGRTFTLYKFRSMRKDAEKDGAKWASENDDRVTKVGKFIRKTRIDELPQLFNVLKGDMSLIGPRPERPEFDKMLEKEIPYYSLRYLVKPGLTGWAQVNYPYGASISDAENKLTYDLYYVKNASLFLDIEIVLKTIKIVFFAKGR